MAGKDPRRSGNPSIRSTSTGRPDSPQARGLFVDRSRAALIVLSRLPPVVIPAAMLVAMVVGLSAPLPIALPALAVAVAFVGWLAYLSWPALTSSGRLVRVAMLCLVVVAGVARCVGWL